MSVTNVFHQCPDEIYIRRTTCVFPIFLPLLIKWKYIFYQGNLNDLNCVSWTFLDQSLAKGKIIFRPFITTLWVGETTFPSETAQRRHLIEQNWILLGRRKRIDDEQSIIKVHNIKTKMIWYIRIHVIFYPLINCLEYLEEKEDKLCNLHPQIPNTNLQRPFLLNENECVLNLEAMKANLGATCSEISKWHDIHHE